MCCGVFRHITKVRDAGLMLGGSRHAPLPLGGRGWGWASRRDRTFAGLRPPLPLARKRPPTRPPPQAGEESAGGNRHRFRSTTVGIRQPSPRSSPRPRDPCVCLHPAHRALISFRSLSFRSSFRRPRCGGTLIRAYRAPACAPVGAGAVRAPDCACARETTARRTSPMSSRGIFLRRRRRGRRGADAASFHFILAQNFPGQALLGIIPEFFEPRPGSDPRPLG